MLLYLWVNKYKHISKTGFNLSSHYDFNFILEKDSQGSDGITGTLTCEKKINPKIFHEQIIDIKGIIGENGCGKSTVLEILIQNIMTNESFYFDGFIITDKFIFNRKGIDFGNSLKEIKHFDWEEITNLKIVNYNRTGKKMLASQDIRYYTPGQIATTYLDYLSIIHYSPLLNIDRILNIEGVAGSTKNWETDYWHYYDLTTENCIVEDYNTYAGMISYYITGESELLVHRSAESKRNLEFLSDEIYQKLPFKNHITSITIRLNDFYQRFWESIDGFIKRDEEFQGALEERIASLKGDEMIKKSKITQLEANLYISFLYGALKFEYKDRIDFSNGGESNALFSTIELFLSSTKRTKTHKTILKKFLENANFPEQLQSIIFFNIEKAIEFIRTSPHIINRNNYDFTISLSDPSAIKQFTKLFFDDFILREKSFVFNIFSIEYVGLSSGEKNLLSMFSRFKRVVDTIPKSQSEIVFILDEPEVMLHPQWQTSFIKLLNENLPKLFPQKKIQILISSHSPMLVSDLPKNNILFLKKDDQTGRCIVAELKNMQHTFGANIHSLYSDAFFLKDKGGAMGEFAKGIIKNVINELNNDTPKNASYLKSIIDMVGEPLIKNQLLDLFYRKFPEQRIDNIDERISFLERELALNKELKNNHENNR